MTYLPRSDNQRPLFQQNEYYSQWKVQGQVKYCQDMSFAENIAEVLTFQLLLIQVPGCDAENHHPASL